MKPVKSKRPIRLENNWRSKTLENLEKDHWGEPEYQSHLVTRCHALRKVVIDDFTTEDLRLMIGQNIGLPYLMIKAIDVLKDDLFAEGDHFRGDLLKNVVGVEPNFWKENKTLWAEMNELIKNRRAEIQETCKWVDLARFDSAL